MKFFLISFLFLAAIGCEAQDSKIIKPDTTKITAAKGETPPTFPGGTTGWNAFLAKNFRYPDEAVNNEIQGNVIVQFDVDEDGTTSNIRAISGPKKGGLREEAVRVVTLSGKWLPATSNGVKVKGTAKQTLSFKMMK